MKYFKANLLLYITIIFFAGYACSDLSGINNGKKTSKGDDLFSFSPRSVKQAEKHKQSLKSKSIVSDVEIAEISDDAISFFREKQIFNFNVSATKKFQINTTKITENRNGSTSLVGELVDGYGFSVLVRTPKGISGTLRTKDKLYKVEPAAGDLAVISLIDETRFPQEHSSEIPLGPMADSLSKTNISNLKAKSSSPFTAQSYHAPNGGPTHGVLVLYTQSVANNTSDITGLIQTANDETNQIYANSNVSQNVYIAHSEQTSYSESGRSFEDHTDALSNTSDGLMDNVPSLRDQYNADIVVLLVNDSEACGRANEIGASKEGAVVAVHYSCATGYYSYAHELGHLFGARHDRAVDNTSSPYQYGHGYVDPNGNWRTVMAYGDACNDCSRMPYWSNPDINYPPTGQAMGTSTYEDNARAVANRKYEFRDFYTLDRPADFTFTNEYSYDDYPNFTWDSAPDIEVTKIWRCIEDLSSPALECDIFNNPSIDFDVQHYQYPSDPEEFTDPYVTIENFSKQCNTETMAIYYATSENYTGVSDLTHRINVCVEYP